jgi:hypothetical protein
MVVACHGECVLQAGILAMTRKAREFDEGGKVVRLHWWMWLRYGDVLS